MKVRLDCDCKFDSDYLEVTIGGLYPCSEHGTRTVTCVMQVVSPPETVKIDLNMFRRFQEHG